MGFGLLVSLDHDVFHKAFVDPDGQYAFRTEVDVTGLDQNIAFRLVMSFNGLQVRGKRLGIEHFAGLDSHERL